VLLLAKTYTSHYCIQNIKDGIHIQEYKINKESLVHFASLFQLKVKKNLRKSWTRFQEKLRKLRLVQKDL